MEPMRIISQSCKDFSSDLYKIVTSQNRDNIIICPFGVHLVLAMATSGASGSTKSEMRRVLHLDDNDSRNWHGFQILIEALSKISDIDVDVATRILVSDQFPIKPEFNLILQTRFYSESDSVNFAEEEQTVAIINEWCREKTKNNIVQIIKSDDITPITVAILLNAVYFKAKWTRMFGKNDTRQNTFHVDRTTQKKVWTMFTYGSFICGNLDEINATFVQLPYVSNQGNFKMIVFVPNEIEGLLEIEKKLENIDYNSIDKRGREERIRLYLPKFKIKSTIDLSEHIKKIGMNKIFSAAANFSEISDKPIKINRIMQKTFLEVDEEGTKASAVTEFGIDLVSVRFFPKEILRVDRPFLAIIMYEEMPLFYARVIDPSINQGGNEIHLAPENFPLDLSM